MTPLDGILRGRAGVDATLKDGAGTHVELLCARRTPRNKMHPKQPSFKPFRSVIAGLIRNRWIPGRARDDNCFVIAGLTRNPEVMDAGSSPA
jgi:hypothetical protein